ncbi:MAG: divergent polysaccharide deacetylase family protein [Thioalkalispiraceae bacterium]|jgi:polysaccharide deacetylase 2 family uncharacterized protein YibQ
MRLLISLLLFAVFTAHTHAEQHATQFEQPRVAIIIDDLGDRLKDGRRVIDLPGQITVGVLPFTPYAKTLADYAVEHHKEILLHLPMEAMEDRRLGKAGLRSSMSKDEFLHSLKTSLSYIKNISGVNNHMGSRLTQDKQMMNWLMQGILHYGDLYFVDSRTISTSYALAAAKEIGLESATRDVFLDHDRSQEKIRKQWNYLLKTARQKGSAIAIAHPYPETIQFLNQALLELEETDIKLVSVSGLIRWRHNRGKLAWQNQTSSSP